MKIKNIGKAIGEIEIDGKRTKRVFGWIFKWVMVLVVFGIAALIVSKYRGY